MAYKYLIKDKASGKKRLVEASSPAVAIAHVAKDGFSAERVSDDVAEMLGLPLEKVTADKAAATEEKPDTEKGGKGGNA
jgi:hypothetical protein